MKKLVLVALAVLLFVFPAFAENSTVPVTVYVRNPSGDIAGGAYVSLVPAWRPFSRPLLESVVESGVLTGRVVPGTYTVVAGAKGFAIGSQLLTVLEKEPASISIELPPLTRVSGNVNDEHGDPIAGVRVATLTAAVAPPLGTLSELAVRTLGGPDSSTVTDASGAWSLPLPQGTVPLLFEATGYGAEWRTYKTQDAAALDVVLKKGAALHVKADRTDRDLVITMQRDGDAGSGVPSDWQRQVWARFATSAETKWESLQAGKYTMYAKYPDPKFFMPRAVKIGEVTLGAGAQELNVTLPPARTASASAAALFIAGAHRKDLGDLIEGYGADAQGARKRVDVAAEETSGGVVLHLKNESIAAPFFAVTATAVIPAFPDLAQPDKSGQPLRGVVHPRADAKLVVHSAEKELAFPQSGRVVLRDCGKVNRVTVPAEIQAGANVRFIAPAACHSLTLFIDPFEPIVIEKRLDGGEQSLGTFVLRSSAAADVRVVRDPGAGIVAGATVRAVMRSDEYRGASVVVGETMTGDDGWAHFTALPIFRDIRFLALTGSGEASLPAEVRLEPHGHAVVDPLAIPKPAELVVEPRIDPQFKSRFPAVSILNVRLRSVDALHESSDDHAQQPDESGLSRFAGLRPGTWRVLTDIKVAGTATSIESEDIELKSGDSRRFIANVKPLVFECHVTANGKPVSSRADIVNAAGTGAQRLYFNSNDNGVFQAVLPVGGVYQVEVALLYRTEGTQSGELPVGEIDFSTPERPVEIKVPEAHAIAYVRVGERPIEHASVYATLQQQGHAEVQSLLLGRVTDEGGRAGFDGLLPGVWTFSVHDEQSGMGAEKAVTIREGEAAAVGLDLKWSKAFKGMVRDAGGMPLPRAHVDCVYQGLAGIPTIAGGDSDYEGRFEIQVDAPAESALCDVIGPVGGIDAFRVASGQPADITLPAASGAVQIADWPQQQHPETFWLAASDGRVISLDSVAQRVGRRGAPLSLAGLASGRWRLVRIETMPQWMALGSGMAASLPAVTDLALDAGASQTLHLNSHSAP